MNGIFQGNRSGASFFMHMGLKHNCEFYEKEKQQMIPYMIIHALVKTFEMNDINIDLQ